MNRRDFSSAVARLRNPERSTPDKWSDLADALVAMSEPTPSGAICGRMIDSYMSCTRPEGHEGFCCCGNVPEEAFRRG
jgi:hypothetical protein